MSRDIQLRAPSRWTPAAWTTCLLGVAGVVVALFGWQWARASAAAKSAERRQQRVAELDGDAAAAADRLAAWVETSRAGRLADLPMDVDVVSVAHRPERLPVEAMSVTPFREAERLEHGLGDAEAARAEYLRVLEHTGAALSPAARTLGWRRVGLLARQAGDERASRAALYRALDVVGAPDRERLLCEFELVRVGDASATELVERIDGGDFAGVSPGERAHIADRLGVAGGETPQRRGLRALQHILEADAADMPLRTGVDEIAWQLRRTDGATDLVLVSLGRLVEAAVPGVSTRLVEAGVPPFEDETVDVDRVGATQADPARARRAPTTGERAIALPPPFPAGLTISVGDRGFEQLEREHGAAFRARLAPPLSAAVLFIGAALLLGQSARRAQRLERRKLDFLYAVTHELKTPLAGIQLAAETIERHGASDPDRVPEFAAVIAGEVRRLDRKIQDVLDVAAGTRRLADDRESFDVVAATRVVVDEYRPAAAEAGRRVDLELVGESSRARETADAQADGRDLPDTTSGVSVFMRGSRDLFAQAIAGLLDNAIKFGRSGDVRVSIDRGNRGMSILVDDAGPGIRSVDAARVFEPFFRAVPAEDGHVAGTGLGLMLVRQCVAGFGGRISLTESALGGAAFRIDIPEDRVDG